MPRVPDVFSNRRGVLPWGVGVRPLLVPVSVAYGLPLPVGEVVGDGTDREEWEGLAVPLRAWPVRRS